MKFRSASDQLPNVGMQLAPLVDVLFLLLIFFIFSISIAKFESEMEISVPAAETTTDTRPNVGEIMVNVRKDGTIVVQSDILSEAQLLEKLKIISQANEDQAVILRGDQNAPYQKIVDVLDVIQKAGIWNVAFATKQETR